jgi:hypothetical protein
VVEIHSPRPFISLESNTYSHLQTGSDLIVGPFAPTTAFFDGTSKPKPILSATSLQNPTSYRILSYASDIARRPSIPALSQRNGDAAEGRGTLRNHGEITIRQPQERVSVRWDDGGIDALFATAAEFTSISRRSA